ncbi:hypothetical protein C1H46_001347 [Malus baccata]|uniref:Uncharacterized protein n=1 Tax=Malus baccata TaxID=106549 RepID=A0A540NPL5_MALBA|nr:hypothetical protein C1H46_001347 [Malus baccata]
MESVESKSESGGSGSGTVLVAVIIPSGVGVAVESRVSSPSPLSKSDVLSIFLYPQHKLHSIRENPPVLAAWCNYNIEGMGLIHHLKSKVKNQKLKSIVQLGRNYLSSKTEKFVLQCYICGVENGEPQAYIINRHWDILHVPKCGSNGDCQCSRLKINLHTRKLKFGVHCIGSGASFALENLRFSFEGVDEIRDDTGEFNIENLSKGGDLTLDEVHTILLHAVFDAALLDSHCGGPFWVSSIPTIGVGGIVSQPPCDFVSAYKCFHSTYETLHESHIFLIYRRDLEGTDYGGIIVKNLIPAEVTRFVGYPVAELAGDYVLHMMVLVDVGCVKQLGSIFDPIADAYEFSDAGMFCKDLSQLKFCIVDKSKLDENGHGVQSEDIRDSEYIFVGLPNLNFLNSLILDEKSINFER